jgi:anion-transporting  ArsA/GET3 family ATPase
VRSGLATAVASARVLVCVGTGGVGKTTTSAVIAMQAARLGRTALVLTIDPARRLATSLGVDRIPDEPTCLGRTPAGGELWAAMLDMKSAFDGIVERYAPDAASRDRLLANRFYRFFSTSLAGAQELAASERLFELAASGQFDLVVLDTPPASNAADFFDAPRRFYEALDTAAFHWLVGATSAVARRSLRLGIGAGFVTRTIARFTGTQFLEELSEFLTHMSGLFEGFKHRTFETARLLASSETSFVVVTSTDPRVVDEALDFARRLQGQQLHLGGVVINRVRPTMPDRVDAGELKAALGRVATADLVDRLIANAREVDELGQQDNACIRTMSSTLGDAVPVIPVPFYGRDVHTLDVLEGMRRDIFGG